MKETGFYTIKDQFFEDMSDPYLKGNKAGGRPHYYCFEDTSTGMFWMIPLSSRIDKYKQIMQKKEKVGKSCDIIHIAKLDNSRESAFLIQDMFPIMEAVRSGGDLENIGGSSKYCKDLVCPDGCVMFRLKAKELGNENFYKGKFFD